MKLLNTSDGIFVRLEIEEVGRLCKPGTGADTCVWLCYGAEGFECLYYNQEAPNLYGETLKSRWERGDTISKRDGCDEISKMLK